MHREAGVSSPDGSAQVQVHISSLTTARVQVLGKMGQRRSAGALAPPCRSSRPIRTGRAGAAADGRRSLPELCAPRSPRLLKKSKLDRGERISKRNLPSAFSRVSRSLNSDVKYSVMACLRGENAVTIQSISRPLGYLRRRSPNPTMLLPHIFGFDFVASCMMPATMPQSRRTSSSLMAAEERGDGSRSPWSSVLP